MRLKREIAGEGYSVLMGDWNASRGGGRKTDEPSGRPCAHRRRNGSAGFCERDDQAISGFAGWFRLVMTSANEPRSGSLRRVPCRAFRPHQSPRTIAEIQAVKIKLI